MIYCVDIWIKGVCWNMDRRALGVSREDRMTCLSILVPHQLLDSLCQSWMVLDVK